MYEIELYHHGVKGMKWGVRRYQNKDGSLTPKGIKRYATRGYTEDSYRMNKTRAGRLYDSITGAHKIQGKMKYETSTNKQNQERAKKYVSENGITTSNIKNGIKAASKAIGTLSLTYTADQIFFGGAGTDLIKKGAKALGRTVITAYTVAKGGRDIHWYD